MRTKQALRSSGALRLKTPLSGVGFMTSAQRRYLARGLRQPGGKLPLFDEEGQEISHRTIEACVAHGWAKPWSRNPVKPGWLVCRLTELGYRALGKNPPRRAFDG
jgi:hypothetical protein